MCEKSVRPAKYFSALFGFELELLAVAMAKIYSDSLIH
jgi:hypothetical protein